MDRYLAIPLRVTDGGRAAAGFKGVAGDCVTRAIAVATGRSYREVYDTINRLAGRPVARTGVPKSVTRKAMEFYGGRWVATMHIGQGCKVHLRSDELPQGRLVVNVTRHVAAVINGVLHDTHDCSRGGTRCVYGYWIF